jgi:hypothetical protein
MFESEQFFKGITRDPKHFGAGIKASMEMKVGREASN